MSEEKQRYKMVFNPAAARFISNRVRISPLSMTQQIHGIFDQEGSQWYGSGAAVSVTKVDSESRGDDGTALVCHLSFNDAAELVLRGWMPPEVPSIPAFVRDLVDGGFDVESPRWRRSGCCVESVEPLS